MVGSPQLPRPDLDPRWVTVDEFCSCTPEKLELIGGVIEGAAPLFMLLLSSIGLRRAVELVGHATWRRALEDVPG